MCQRLLKGDDDFLDISFTDTRLVGWEGWYVAVLEDDVM